MREAPAQVKSAIGGQQGMDDAIGVREIGPDSVSDARLSPVRRLAEEKERQNSSKPFQLAAAILFLPKTQTIRRHLPLRTEPVTFQFICRWKSKKYSRVLGLSRIVTRAFGPHCGPKETV
jgi:hypothetical protein